TALIDAFDREWSRFRLDSLVSDLAREGGETDAPEDAVAMLDAYVRLSEATDGAVNPLVGTSLEQLGYGPDYSLRAAEPVPAIRRWTERLTWADDRLVLTEPSVIDVGAIGKGRLVDRVLDLLSG